MLKKLFVEVQDMAVGITLPENGNESEAIALDTECFGICAVSRPSAASLEAP